MGFGVWGGVWECKKVEVWLGTTTWLTCITFGWGFGVEGFRIQGLGFRLW